jgi:anti-sigma-K factor RskA
VNDDDLHLLAGPYALGALDDDEETRFVSHLNTCTACQNEVRGFSAVRDELGRAGAETPPPDLRARVLAQARDTAQEPVSLSARRASRSRRTVTQTLLAAAAAVVLLGGGIAYFQTRSDRSDAEALVEVLSAADAQTMPLHGDDDADVRVVWSPAQGEAVLLADDMSSPEAGHDFELWFLDGGSPVSALVFEPDEGNVRQRFDVPEAGFEALAVTVEADGGSDGGPTTPPRYQSDTSA